MTEEEKKAAEEAVKQQEEADFEASLEGLSDEEKEQKRAEKKESSSQSNNDYDDLLAAERKRREEAETALEKIRLKSREAFENRKEQKEKEDELKDKGFSREEIKAILDEERENMRKELRQEQAVEIAASLGESVKESEVILEIWKNRKLSGTLRQQLEEAKAIASFKRTSAKNDELKRALSSKEGVKQTGEDAYRKPFIKAPEMNANDKQVLQGYVWDNGKQAFKKTIAGGRKIFYVTKDFSKKWTEDAPKQ